MKRYATVLTIAGSDSGGGAGIQADLKTIAACGCYGTSALTAITAQNTLGVQAIHPVPIAVLEAQIRAVFDDIGADAVKLGMLHSAGVVRCVAALLAEYGPAHVVLDPVMVATSGDRLIEDDAVEALQQELFPQATMITPNLDEARILAGEPITDPAAMTRAAAGLGRRFSLSVLIKGGHLAGDHVIDVLYDRARDTIETFSSPRTETGNTHGTGCTLAAAIASLLARGQSIRQATADAIAYVSAAIAAGAEYRLGRGHGPVHHFHRCWE